MLHSGALELLCHSKAWSGRLHGDSASFIGVKVIHQDQPLNYYLKVDQDGKKYITLNGQVVRKKTEIQSILRVNYISSDSLFYISSQPSYRRNRLDQSISQFSYTYRKNLATYKRLIAQKNQLLKQFGDDSLISNINQLLVPLIKLLNAERTKYLTDIQKIMAKYLKGSPYIDGDVDIVFNSKVQFGASEDEIFKELSKSLSREKIVKSSIFGIHRDDYTFSINDRNVKLFYSRGICRIVSYFFQLAESTFLQQSMSLPMLLLLDEPFSEIHPDLKERLIQSIPKDMYKIYTSTQVDELMFLKHSKSYGITDGVLCSH